MNATPSNAERTVTGRVQSANNKTHLRSNAAVADNLGQHPAADGIRREVANLWAKVAAQHGTDPGTIEQAAAHEAGHLICGLTLGGEFRKGRLHHYGDGTWGGYSESYNPLIHTDAGEVFAPAAAPDRALALMVILAGGIMGEATVGLHHPASSLDEALVVNGVCEEAGFEPVTAWTAAAAIINKNRVAFDTLRGLLVRQRRLFKSDVARACRSLVRGDVGVAA